MELVGEEGVGLFTVGKREVRGGEGEKARPLGGGTGGIKGFERSESPMTSSVKESHRCGCDLACGSRGDGLTRGWVERERGTHTLCSIREGVVTSRVCGGPHRDQTSLVVSL